MDQRPRRERGRYRVLPGMTPYAACYGGHQFGTWAGQLGDGRAITLAEVLRPEGKRYDLQLKGAGGTPYSRFADGRARGGRLQPRHHGLQGGDAGLQVGRHGAAYRAANLGQDLLRQLSDAGVVHGR